MTKPEIQKSASSKKSDLSPTSIASDTEVLCFDVRCSNEGEQSEWYGFQIVFSAKSDEGPIRLKLQLRTQDSWFDKTWGEKYWTELERLNLDRCHSTWSPRLFPCRLVCVAVNSVDSLDRNSITAEFRNLLLSGIDSRVEHNGRFKAFLLSNKRYATNKYVVHARRNKATEAIHQMLSELKAPSTDGLVKLSELSAQTAIALGDWALLQGPRIADLAITGNEIKQSKNDFEKVLALEPISFFKWFDNSLPNSTRKEMQEFVKQWVALQAGKHGFQGFPAEKAVVKKHEIASGVQLRLDQVGLAIDCQHVRRKSTKPCGDTSGRLSAIGKTTAPAGQYYIKHNSKAAGRADHCASQVFPSLKLVAL